MEVCQSCKTKHDLVEAKGIYHCPNPLCRGSGGSFFRSTLESYQETDAHHERVDHTEWLTKGILKAVERQILDEDDIEALLKQVREMIADRLTQGRGKQEGKGA